MIFQGFGAAHRFHRDSIAPAASGCSLLSWGPLSFRGCAQGRVEDACRLRPGSLFDSISIPKGLHPKLEQVPVSQGVRCSYLSISGMRSRALVAERSVVRAYQLYVMREKSWDWIGTIDANSHAEAFQAALLSLGPDDENLPIRLEQDVEGAYRKPVCR